jgi:hypothetical protein
MSKASSFDDPAGRELLAMLRKARRNTFGDPMYHSGRKNKEFASPYLEFLDTLEKAVRKMPQIYEFDPGHADGIRHADLDAGERVLNEMIYECQRSLEGIANAKIDQEARSWARGMGLRG